MNRVKMVFCYNTVHETFAFIYIVGFWQAAEKLPFCVTLSKAKGLKGFKMRDSQNDIFCDI
jgi:hypothetical protein